LAANLRLGRAVPAIRGGGSGQEEIAWTMAACQPGFAEPGFIMQPKAALACIAQKRHKAIDV
jgi:hypothetical protein